ncbi:MAG: DUF4422 domain-containing protein [Clostridia bacterium]|nr:DUF4422 domain-containing protein [Clostridia bacterium]
MRYAVAVALHKRYWLPDEPLYVPMQAGAALHEDLGLLRDDTGDHISLRNPAFSELTAQYWLWKNCDAEVCGLCHYRRYFTVTPFGPRKTRILTLPQAETLLQHADVIIPTPRIYLIETNYTQYIHAHHAVDLDTTRQIIAERHQAFLAAYDRVMKRRWGRRFNMCIMRRAQFDAYSAWLFDVLFELEKRLDVSGYNEKDSRVFGYVAERLMDVWLEQTRPRMRQVRVLNLESQHWLKKIATFLRRRFLSDERMNQQR